MNYYRTECFVYAFSVTKRTIVTDTTVHYNIVVRYFNLAFQVYIIILVMCSSIKYFCIFISANTQF